MYELGLAIGSLLLAHDETRDALTEAYADRDCHDSALAVLVEKRILDEAICEGVLDAVEAVRYCLTTTGEAAGDAAA